METINGYPILDATHGSYRRPYNIINGNVDPLALLDTGTTSHLNYNATPFTITGGSADAESNQLRMLNALGWKHRGACDNLLSNALASFEDGSTGGVVWLNGLGLSNSSTWSNHGTKSLKGVYAASPGDNPMTNVWALVAAGSQYTFSARGKAVAKTLKLGVAYDGTGGTRVYSNIIAEGAEGRMSVTFTIPADASYCYLMLVPGAFTGCEFYADSLLLEAGAVAHSFCLDSALATSVTLANPLLAGEPFLLVLLVNSSWAGNDGVEHNLATFSKSGNSRLYLQKNSANRLLWYVKDAAGTAYSLESAVLNATSWAANTNHIVFAGRNTAGVLYLHINNVAATSFTGTARFEGAMNASVNIGTYPTGAFPAEAAILPALFRGEYSTAQLTRLYYALRSVWFPALESWM